MQYNGRVSNRRERDGWARGSLDFGSICYYAAALFDVTDDGVPEMILAEAGGLAGKE